MPATRRDSSENPMNSDRSLMKTTATRFIASISEFWSESAQSNMGCWSACKARVRLQA